MMAGIEVPHKTVRDNIADALDLIVHIERRNGQRYVDEVLGIDGYDSVGDRYELQTLYARQPQSNA
jgi:Flp pilus assembly CpaF family ATPase